MEAGGGGRRELLDRKSKSGGRNEGSREENIQDIEWPRGKAARGLFVMGVTHSVEFH
jgi:hypothetical protein